MNRWRNGSLWVVCFCICGFISFCGETQEGSRDNAADAYLNLHDTVSYVGMAVCKNCHYSIWETFSQTGMGLSIDHATREKSAATFDKHALVYDMLNDFYYHPYWKGDTLYIKEYRLEGSDTVHSRQEAIDYIIGSGQHTNSHLYQVNGYMYQAPITFYTQKGQWDMAPGFEDGASSRFSRIIGQECMTCHNALPDFETSSVNKFNHVPTGIDCERCHGPGEIHVREKLAGNLVDTSQYIDHTIVNPKDLSQAQQMSLCQRCHLQGVAVLKAKSWDDFKPGMHLNEVMNVFLPRFAGAENEFIMASQADRLRQSKCYQLSDMSCITCHNPHISVNVTPIADFDQACQNCHTESSKVVCSERMEVRQSKNDNCSGCHMPKSGSIDIPHVFITDHYIRKENLKVEPQNLTIDEVEEVKQFLGLECMTKDQPSALEIAAGYLAYYEKFSSQPHLLDSVKYYLDEAERNNERPFHELIHYYFLTGNYQAIIHRSRVTKYGDPGGWTHYRIAEAYLALGQIEIATGNFQKAANTSPYNLDFQAKLAHVQFTANKNYPVAKEIYQFILGELPIHKEALNSLGYIYLMEGNITEGERLLNKAISLYPDYELAWLNKVNVSMQKKDHTTAKILLEKVLQINPNNEQAKAILEQLNSI